MVLSVAVRATHSNSGYLYRWVHEVTALLPENPKDRYREVGGHALWGRPHRSQVPWLLVRESTALEATHFRRIITFSWIRCCKLQHEWFRGRCSPFCSPNLQCSSANRWTRSVTEQSHQLSVVDISFSFRKTLRPPGQVFHWLCIIFTEQ